MFRFLLKRLLLLIPTLAVISLLVFVLKVNAPIDHTAEMMKTMGRPMDSEIRKKERKRMHHKLGLDLPLFYVSMASLAAPDTLNRIEDPGKRKAANRLIRAYGNWGEIQEYQNSFSEGLKVLNALRKGTLSDSEKEELSSLEAGLRHLEKEYDSKKIKAGMIRLEEEAQEIPQQAYVILTNIALGFNLVESNATPWKNYVPIISFHGQNQYHSWLFGDGKNSKGVIRGDFGISYMSKKPVTQLISEKIGWTMFFSLISILLAFAISIPLGKKAARKKGGRFDRWSGSGLFLLYAVPSFWMAMILLVFFANPSFLSWFEPSGVKPVTGYPEGAGLLQRIGVSLPYLVLPLVCYTYGSLAFLSRTLRASLLEILHLDFIRTARAKGLSEKTVVSKHGFRNALLPLITIMANIFPAAVSGSVILEEIFGIPGLGREIFNAIQYQDFPVIVAMLVLTGLLTVIGITVADVLYAVADPRIRFSKSVSST